MHVNYTVIGLYRTGGIGTVVEVTNRLIERGHEASITLLIGSSNSWPIKAKIVQPRLKVFARLRRELAQACARISLGSFFRSDDLHNDPSYRLCMMAELGELIPECDVNVATEWSTALPVYMSGRGIGFYHMQHYEELFIPPGPQNSFARIMARSGYELPLVKIANSTWLRNQIKGKFGEDVAVINHAPNHRIFYPQEVNKVQGKMRVVCLGRRAKWKGFEDALAAMRIVFGKQPNVEWHVYGSEPSLPYVDAQAPYTYLSNITDEELACLYCSAHVVLCPSWYESFPAPPLEAMACGTPVVTTQIGTEDYAVHEENALVVPPRDPAAMAEATLRLLSDEELRVRLSSNGIETAKQFTWDKTTDKLEELFKKHVSGE